MKKPTVAELLAKIEQLEKRLAMLEARPIVHPYPLFFGPSPLQPPPAPHWLWKDPCSPPWTITCRTGTGEGWNG